MTSSNTESFVLDETCSCGSRLRIEIPSNANSTDGLAWLSRFDSWRKNHAEKCPVERRAARQAEAMKGVRV